MVKEPSDRGRGHETPTGGVVKGPYTGEGGVNPEN